MKKILKFFVMIMMVVALTGCMKINMNVEVQSDLTTKMSVEMLMEESLLSMQGEDPDEVVKEMQEQILSEEELKDAKVTTIDKTIDGATWKGVSIEGIADTESNTSITVKKETVDGKEKIVLTLPMDEMSDEMDAESLTSMGYSVDQMKKLGMEMNVTIKMPGTASCNVGTVNGDTVTIDLLELMVNGSNEDVVVTSEIASGGFDMNMILIAVVVIVVIGGVVIFLKKKKKPVEETVVTPVDEPSVETTPVVEEKVEEVVEEASDSNNEEPTVETVEEKDSEIKEDSKEETEE